MKQETSLTSLAILSNRIDKGSDYLDFFVPLVEFVLFKNNPFITSHNIAKLVEEEFGLLIPHETIEIILNRLVKRKVLAKEEEGGLRIKDIPKAVKGFDERRIKIQRKIDSLVNHLRSFSKQQFNIDLNEEEASKSLISFFTDFSASFVNFVLKKGELPLRGKYDTKGITLVSRFIQHAEKNDLQSFDDLIDLAHGTMLANALIIPTNLSQIGNFKKVRFFLDTPLILNLLKFSGDIYYESTKQLIGLITNLKGKICCFSHTLEETRLVIKSSAENLNLSTGYGGVVEYAKEYSLTKSDLLIIADTIEDTLKEAGIKVVQTPPYTPDHQINEAELEKRLDFYRNQRAKENDINAIRSIFVLRGGKYITGIKECSAILVTSNSSLTKQTQIFCNQHKNSFSPIITSFTLKTIAWLHNTPDSKVPKLEVIAYSYAATQPSPGFLNETALRIEEMKEQGRISFNDYQVLKAYTVQQDLFEFTQLEDKAVSADSIEKYLEHLRAQVRDEESKKTAPLIEELAVLKKEKASNDALISKRIKNSKNIGDKIAKYFVLGISIILIIASTWQFLRMNYFGLGGKIWERILNAMLFLIGLFGSIDTFKFQLYKKLNPLTKKIVYAYLAWKEIGFKLPHESEFE